MGLFDETYRSDAAFSLPGLQQGSSGPQTSGDLFNSLASFGGNTSNLMQDGGFWQNLWKGFTDNKEDINNALGGFGTLGKFYLAYQGLKGQKDQQRFQQQAWQQNFDAQVKDMENKYRERWAARNNSMAARGLEYQSLEGYLNDRRIG